MQIPKCSTRLAFVALVTILALLLAVSGAEKIRRNEGKDERDLRFFIGLYSQLSSFVRELFSFVLSLPRTLFGFILTIISYLWDILTGVVLFLGSSSSAITTTTASTVQTTSTIPMSPISSAVMTTSATDLSTTAAASSPVNQTTSLATSPAMTTSATDPSTTAVSSQTTVSPSTLSSMSSSLSTSSFPSISITTSSSSSTTSTMSTTTSIPSKYVFISSLIYAGDLMGLQGADDRCNILAQDANLTGLYRAWLSDDIASPSTRFNQSLGPYILRTGVEVAANYATLVQGGLNVNINVNEKGEVVRVDDNVWTGTENNGEKNMVNCGNWTISDCSANGGAGLITDPSSWSSIGGNSCERSNRIYCFEQ